MEKERFERYGYLCRQIEKLSAPVMDTVRGSAADPPYQERTFTIQGSRSSERLEQYKKDLKEIEDFMEKTTEEDREILETVAKYGKKWNIVRRELNTWKSPDSIRKKYERIFQKY